MGDDSVERRVARPTLAAEMYALTSGTEAVDWLRAVIA